MGRTKFVSPPCEAAAFHCKEMPVSEPKPANTPEHATRSDSTEGFCQYGPGTNHPEPTVQMLLDLAEGRVTEMHQCNEDSGGIAAHRSGDSLVIGETFIPDFHSALKGWRSYPNNYLTFTGDLRLDARKMVRFLRPGWDGMHAHEWDNAESLAQVKISKNTKQEPEGKVRYIT